MARWIKLARRESLVPVGTYAVLIAAALMTTYGVLHEIGTRAPDKWCTEEVARQCAPIAARWRQDRDEVFVTPGLWASTNFEERQKFAIWAATCVLDDAATIRDNITGKVLATWHPIWRYSIKE